MVRREAHDACGRGVLGRPGRELKAAEEEEARLQADLAAIEEVEVKRLAQEAKEERLRAEVAEARRLEEEAALAMYERSTLQVRYLLRLC